MNEFTFLSLFAGIGGFEKGLEDAEWVCKGQVEIDEHATKVLERHWPEVARFRDVRDCGKHNLPTVKLICGGFPCQDVSVAGRREGLAGERSGLWFEFYRVLKETRPEWFIIENVPGLLSSRKGRDFAIIIQGLAELRYGVAWRVLDAQYFRVAQRRRRVFIVGHLGDGRAAKVLFEQEGGARDSPPSRETGARVASYAKSGFGEYREGLTTLRVGGGDDSQGVVVQSRVATYTIQTNDGGNHKRKDRPHGGMYVKEAEQALTVGSSDQTVVAHALTTRVGQRLEGSDTYVLVQHFTFTDREHSCGATLNETTDALQAHPQSDTSNVQRGILTFQDNASAHQSMNPSSIAPSLDVGKAGGTCVHENFGVRRLSPTECERLQGFPDGHTAGQSDSKRYKQLGNAVAVPVVEWIGRRIMQVCNGEKVL